MKLSILVAALVACVPLSVLAKGDVANGEKLSATCATCHGPGGAKPVQPDYPVLAGQHQDYLAAALNQYKSGKRKNAIMAGFAGQLKAQDILDLSTYFASQPSPLQNKY